MRRHENYERLALLARRSHARGRSVAGITPGDVDLARLYCHAFRAHVIGAFHATRVAVEELGPADAASFFRRQALAGLARLANQALDPVFSDFRAVVSTFHRYESGIA